MTKRVINTFLDPWKTAKRETSKDPGYIDQHWFIKGTRYFFERLVIGVPFLKKSTLNGGIQFILFVIQTILITIGYFYNTLFVMFSVILTAYLQFLSNNIATIWNGNRHKALYRGISEHYHHEHREPPDLIALTKSLCNTKNRNIKN